jgi:hypothetical protein
MVYLTALWLPIVLSAVVVFIASSIIHMVLPYHRSDYKKLPNEENLREAMRKEGVTPGNYVFPCPASPKDMNSPEMIEKYNQGPVGLVNVLPNGPPMMAKHLVSWFIYCLVIGVFVAYLAGRTLNAGTHYLAVFRVVGTASLVGYGIGHVSDSIWKGQSWSTTIKNTFDGLVYALLTAGVFGWLWPR